jgi:hypothetical protein
MMQGSESSRLGVIKCRAARPLFDDLRAPCPVSARGAMREDAMMKATTWQRAEMAGSCLLKPWLLRAAALFGASIVIAQCSALPQQDATQPPPPVNYGVLVANVLKTFKGYAAYNNFQISSLRWVHAATGWSWLTCVRYGDRGRAQFYAFFLDERSVINARYDVHTDQCAAQQYVPFDIATGTVGSPTAVLQQPIY